MIRESAIKCLFMHPKHPGRQIYFYMYRNIKNFPKNLFLLPTAQESHKNKRNFMNISKSRWKETRQKFQ